MGIRQRVNKRIKRERVRKDVQYIAVGPANSITEGGRLRIGPNQYLVIKK